MQDYSTLFINYLTPAIWRFYYAWYTAMVCCVRVNSETSEYFDVSRGTRQGSCVSPTFFTIFISDLLVQLKNSESGIRFGDCLINNVTYADDINLMSCTVPDLQSLLDTAQEYSRAWRFDFNPAKYHCLVMKHNKLSREPNFRLGTMPLTNSPSVEVLGFVLSNDGKTSLHFNKRMRNCRATYSSLIADGLCFPGLPPSANSYIWTSKCQALLKYGLGSLHCSETQLSQLNTCQGNLVKRFMGLPTRCHTTPLLTALGVHTLSTVAVNATLSLWFRTFSQNTVLRQLCMFELTEFFNGHIYEGSILSRVCNSGFNPVSAIFKCLPLHTNFNGLHDSVSYICNLNITLNITLI